MVAPQKKKATYTTQQVLEQKISSKISARIAEKSYYTKFTSIPLTKDNARTFNESKQAVTFPFWIRTWVGGCAKRHSSSVREQVPRWNSLQTSTSNHRGSLPIMGTIIFGVNMSLVSFSVSRHLTSKSGNHGWNSFFKCARVLCGYALPDISRCLGEICIWLIWKTNLNACSILLRHRGLKLHNNESSITCQGQGQYANQIFLYFPAKRTETDVKMWEDERVFLTTQLKSIIYLIFARF